MNDSGKKNNGEARKWWEIASCHEEYSLFNELARNPEYTWRTTSGLATVLGWTEEKLQSIMKKFITQNIILIKSAKDGSSQKVAYWERTKEGKQEKEDNSELPF
jgi:hypothetical protein